MFGDIGWAELMIIAVVALIVIGPKDLPEMFRQLGRVMAKLRAMARDFSRAMEDAAKESGMAEAAKDLRAATSAKATGLDKVKAAADSFEKWDPLKPVKDSVKPLTPPPMPAPIAAPNLNAAPTPAQTPAAADKAVKPVKGASAKMPASPQISKAASEKPVSAKPAAPKSAAPKPASTAPASTALGSAKPAAAKPAAAKPALAKQISAPARAVARAPRKKAET